MKKLLISLLIIPTLAFAWEPKSSIEATIPFAPGSGNELVFRSLAKEVEVNTKTSFVIANKPGAGGVLGTEKFSKEPNDGYHVLVVSNVGLAATDKIAVPGDGRTYTTDSFEYVMHIAGGPMAIIASPKDPVDDAKGLVDVLKNSPQTVTFGQSGAASRLSYEIIINKLQIKTGKTGVVKIDHSGPAQTLMDVAGGHVRFGAVPALVANEFYKDGKIKILAVTTDHVIPQFPKVATLNSVVPGVNFAVSWGLLLPKGTSPDIIEWYRKEFTKAVYSQNAKEIYDKNVLFVDSKLLTPSAFKTWIRDREQEWKPIIDSVLKSQ
jgi:tripartite-type tricarboxylate transporter receptor subunit TctC